MGHVIISGGSRMTVPITGTRAGDLAVGTVVKLNEGGTNVDFLVVNQGIPSNSSLYDSSCDGTWLLRKDIKENRQWDTANVYSTYATSTTNTWLNNDYFNILGSMEQRAIKQVKIPYCTGGGASDINSGENGLSTKLFLLGGYEIGWTTSDIGVYYLPIDGAKLDYFESGTGTSAKNKRIANLNGSTSNWWLRSPNINRAVDVFYIVNTGVNNFNNVSQEYGIRPALILPKTAIFDFDTLVLKGG